MKITRKTGKRVYRKRTVRKAKSPTVTLAVKKYVNRMIHTNIENKNQTVNYSGNFGNYSANSALYCYPVTPYTGFMTISQGVLQNNRTGNEIRVRKAMLRYVLRPLGYNVSSNVSPVPTIVEMYLGRIKIAPGDIPGATDFTVLFQNGSSSIAPVGTLKDLVSNINNDYWTIKKRWSHKLGFAEYGGQGGIAQQQYFTNNDFKLNVVKKLDITSIYPKVLKFNDATNQVQGDGLFLFYQAVSANGNDTGSTQQTANIDFWIDLQYEDA